MGAVSARIHTMVEAVDQVGVAAADPSGMVVARILREGREHREVYVARMCGQK